jgi:hypothetical protein
VAVVGKCVIDVLAVSEGGQVDVREITVLSVSLAGVAEVISDVV